MRKKILLIVSVFRVGERIHPVIPELHKFADLDLLQMIHEYYFTRNMMGILIKFLMVEEVRLNNMVQKIIHLVRLLKI